jgi:diguanylate cyclase (GGDEF)-like protein
VRTVPAMHNANGFSAEDWPDLPHARQLRTGIPWLSFTPELEAEFLRSHLDENLTTIRTNLCLAITIAIAFYAMEAMVLGPALNHIPGLIHILIVIPTLLVVLMASFSAHRHRIYQPLTVVAATIYGLSQVAIYMLASGGGITFLFPSLVLATMYVYFLAGLTFYHALASNMIVLFIYLAASSAMQLTNSAFSYNALAIVAANLIGASVVYMHERTSRMRFLEAGLLREMVARDGLTGIQNRRMFDQHILRVWQQAVREQQQVAVLLADIDCFKLYNDRYGHQAGDECLRAVATSLSQCARRPLDFVARFGGEEFAVVLYEANREYVAEVLTRIQRSIAELNIAHDASVVASRLTLSIGAAFIRPSASRTPDGLIQLADEALYSAKEQGRNRVVVMEAEYNLLKTGRFEKRRGEMGR